MKVHRMNSVCYAVIGLFISLFALPNILHTANSDGGVLTGTIRLTSGANSDENTVVYLEGITGTFAAPAQPTVLDQNHEMFIPHLLPLIKGQTVKFTDSETVSHNINVFWGGRTFFNVVQFKNQEHDWAPPRSGKYQIRCNIHREMSAYLLVFEHPFFASVLHQGSAPGQFKIEGIPAGDYTVVAVRDVRGRLEQQEQKVNIKPKQTTSANLAF